MRNGADIKVPDLYHKQAYIVLTSLIVNEVALSYLLYAVKQIEKLPVYRFSVKKHLREASTLRKEYDNKVYRTIKEHNHQFYADMNDRFLEYVGHDLDILYETIKRLYDKAHVPNSSSLATFTQAYTLLTMAVRLNTANKELCKTEGISGVYRRLDMFDLTNILRHVEVAHEEVTKPINGDGDMQEYKMACDILFGKLIDGDILVKTIDTEKELEDNL